MGLAIPFAIEHLVSNAGIEVVVAFTTNWWRWWLVSASLVFQIPVTPVSYTHLTLPTKA